MAPPTFLVSADITAACLHLFHWALDFYTQILGGGDWLVLNGLACLDCGRLS